jgi:hypothetical protein
MKWTFNDLQEMKQFALHLSNELNLHGEVNLANEVKYFSKNTYTTSSEYLGEFRIVLIRVLNLDNKILLGLKDSIRDAIASIDKAFGN